jgi:hypothetical protein
MSRLPPDWPLIRRVVRIVHTAPGGGLHRDHLAEMVQLPPRGRSLSDALGIAYRNKKIDFCGQYVVKPTPARRVDMDGDHARGRVTGGPPPIQPSDHLALRVLDAS